MWKRPVHIETREEGKPRLLSYDGEEAQIVEITASKSAADVAVGMGETD